MTNILRSNSYSGLLLPSILLFAASGIQVAAAQAPPDSITLQAEGPTAILVTWTECVTSDQANCEENFYVYRNPPDPNKVLTTRSAGNLSSISVLDSPLNPSTTYTYTVCTDEMAKGGSNCVSASKKTLPPQPPGGGASGGSSSVGSGSTYTNNSPAPTNLRALSGEATVLLSWVNPSSTMNGLLEVDRAITGGTSPQQIAILDPNGTDPTEPTRYSDTGPLQPHFPYDYYVCNGSPDASRQSCAHSNSVTTWGANPVLTAVRTSPTTVKLSVAVDNLSTLVGLKVTRQGSDDPCRSGSTLANGEQGCKTASVGPGGVPANVPQITTVYDKGPGSSFGASTATAPYVIDLPDDTVTSGVEYYYQAQATWVGPLEQDSQTVTASTTINLHNLPPHKTLVKSLSNVHLVGPKGGAQQKGSISATKTVVAAQAKVKASPNDAQSLYTLGQSYCKAHLQNACVSTMYMSLLQSQKAGTSTLTNQIKTSLANEGVAVSDQ
jgi:hypothetical protein